MAFTSGLIPCLIKALWTVVRVEVQKQLLWWDCHILYGKKRGIMIELRKSVWATHWMFRKVVSKDGDEDGWRPEYMEWPGNLAASIMSEGIMRCDLNASLSRYFGHVSSTGDTKYTLERQCAFSPAMVIHSALRCLPWDCSTAAVYERISNGLRSE